MSTFPVSPRLDFLQWCQSHAPTWSSNALAIGLSAGGATAYTAAVTAAAAASLAQENAQQAAKVATQAANVAFNTLRGLTGDNLRVIRAFAQIQGKPDTIYQLAQIPPPASPSPAPPPAQPVELTAQLDPSSGALTLRWKCSNPGTSGNSYIVRRRLAGETGFTFLGASGSKKFVDSSLMAGPDTVQYTIQGQRGSLTGPVSSIYTVNFGQAPGGGSLQAFVTQESPSQAKLAA